MSLVIQKTETAVHLELEALQEEFQSLDSETSDFINYQAAVIQSNKALAEELAHLKKQNLQGKHSEE